MQVNLVLILIEKAVSYVQPVSANKFNQPKHLTQANRPRTNATLQVLIESADADGDGRISLTDFRKMVRRSFSLCSPCLRTRPLRSRRIRVPGYRMSYVRLSLRACRMPRCRHIHGL
jgi:hypothetical protein